MILLINITRERKKALLSIYPSIKFFIDKTIENTADRIIIENMQYNIDEELKEYHDRVILNGAGPHRKHKTTEATKDKIKKGLKKYFSQFEGQGFHLFPETKRLIGLANKGKIVSQATRDKISEANKGKKRTEEQKKRLSLAKTGQKYKKHAKVKLN